MLRKLVCPAALALALGVLVASPTEAATATGTTAVKTQLQASPKITGGKTILWIPAKTKLTLQCLAVGEKAYGAVAKADPYYYKVTYKGKTGYAIDADLYTAKAATALGLTYCSIPAEPGSPKAGSVTSSSVSLSWSDRSNNETSFKTQYSTDGGKTWKPGASAGANKTSVTVTGLKASTKYTLQVGAHNNAGTKWSAYVYATTAKTPTINPGGCNYRLNGGTAGDYVKDPGKGKTVSTHTIQGKSISVCSPSPQEGYGLQNVAAKYGVSPYHDSVRSGSHSYRDPVTGAVFEGLDGYQCTDLAVRWLFVRDGVRYGRGEDGKPKLWGDGNQFVDLAVAAWPSKYRAIGNGSKDVVRAGDVVSFTSVHVAVVKASNVNASGTGTVTIIQQNAPGQKTLEVKNWVIQGGVKKWLRKR